MLTVTNEWMSMEHWWNNTEDRLAVLFEENESLHNDNSGTAILLSIYFQIWA
jgi:hypothetical protein